MSYKVITSDNITKEINSEAYARSDFITSMFENSSNEDEPPIIQVQSHILDIIDKFLMHYKGLEIQAIKQPLEHKTLHPDDGIPKWDSEFINAISEEDLFEVVTASNYLDIKSLVSLCCARIGLYIKNKIADKYGRIDEEELKFFMANGMTREEVGKLSVEAKWA